MIESNDVVEKLKQKLEEKQIVFDNILEGTLAGYWDWFVQEDREYLSPTFKKMFGYEDHELENTPSTWQRLIHPDDLAVVFENFDKHVASKGAYPFKSEVRYNHKDGSIVWVYCQGKVIEWDKKWNPIRMVGCHVNITSLKKAESTQRYALKLEQKNKELEQFAYVASHDLQEPLRTVSSFVELLNEQYIGKLEGNAPLYLGFISQATKRMSSLIKGLLDHSLLGKNEKLADVDCAKQIASIEADLTQIIVETNTTITAELLPVIKGYKTELRLLFQNLICNAIKFRKPEFDPVINIKVKDKGDRWLFSVSDNGIGIDPQYKDRIFLIFQRLHLKREYEGNGIGLAHCKKIIDLHNGELWLESELGLGSTFYFTIDKNLA